MIVLIPSKVATTSASPSLPDLFFAECTPAVFAEPMNRFAAFRAGVAAHVFDDSKDRKIQLAAELIAA
jgi:hypothetical protein